MAERSRGRSVSLADLCRRVDLRTVNKRVMESLIKANAVGSLGTLGALLDALDDALENGQRHQRDVAAGQFTMFDLFAPVPGDESVQFLDNGEEIPRRERLRWEKELIGLYLSEHPLGDIATELPDYVTAYTGELAEEPDQAKVTIGGILISSRRVITRAGSTMLVATLEDLQGSVEVVVFPKVFEQTAQSWADDNVVLVSGRIDRRDESPQILCEAVHLWDDAVRMGPVAFSAERDRLLAARGGNGRRWDRPPQPERAPIPVEAPVPIALAVAAIGAPEPLEETPAPSDAVPIQSAPESSAATVSVSIGDDVPTERLLGVIESIKSALAGRPGPAPVLLTISVAGAIRQVRLPDLVAWDDNLAELVRRAAGVPVAVELRSDPEERLA